MYCQRLGRPSGCVLAKPLGVSNPRLLWGRTSLYCRRQSSSTTLASEICWRSMSLYQPIKLIEHVCGSNTPSHMNQMTFPSVLIDYREHLQPPAPHSSVVNKVPAPRMAARWVAWVGSPVEALSTPTRLAPGQAQTPFSANRRCRWIGLRMRSAGVPWHGHPARGSRS